MCLIFLLLINSINGYVFNQPKFCSNATWNSSAIIIANAGLVKASANVVIIDKYNNIYLTIGGNNQLQIWFNANIGQSKSITSGLFTPQGLFIQENGDIFIDNGAANSRVDKWTLNATSGVSGMIVSSKCVSLFVDINNTLYCTLFTPSQVVKRSLNSSSLNSTNVAGATGLLNALEAEKGGDQIKCVAAGASIATIAVGTSAPPPRTYTLNGPIAVMLDGNGYFFILEYGGNRLVAESSTGFRCIIGCLDGGSAVYQLNTPYSFSFDIDGNIFISDYGNYRFLKFFFNGNICDTEYTTIVTTEEQSLTTYLDDSSTTYSQMITTNIISVTILSNGQTTYYFIPSTCSSPVAIGLYCNTSNLPCNSLQPCQNNGTCINNNSRLHGYICVCSSGFIGQNCEFDQRLCTPNTCWNNGICQEILNRTFHCNCTNGYQGDNCERKINYCKEKTCLNRGVCQPSLSNYTCKCISTSYSGQHCEIVENKLVLYQTLAKSFSYVAIIAISVVIGYFLIMDLLKYVFGIDPIKPVQKKKRKKGNPTIVRFVYVNTKPENSQKQTIYTIEETIV